MLGWPYGSLQASTSMRSITGGRLRFKLAVPAAAVGHPDGEGLLAVRHRLELEGNQFATRTLGAGDPHPPDARMNRGPIRD
jgi:hypothetical protein